MPDYLLGIDFGTKRIGIALGQTFTQSAKPLTTLPNNSQLWQSLDTIIQEWHIGQIIVGLPLGMDGKEHEMTRQVKNFAKKVQHHTGLPVTFMDERLSSYEAERQFQSLREAQLSKAKNKSQIDAMAAQVILQSWLDYGHNT